MEQCNLPTCTNQGGRAEGHEAFKDEGLAKYDRAGGLGAGIGRLRLFSVAPHLSRGRTPAAGDGGLAPALLRRPARPADLEAPVAVTLRPQRTIAPVGSVVVLVAGVQSGDGYLRTNQRLEWSMAPGSVGQFLAVQDNGWVDLLLGDFNRPRKVNNTFAIGSTSRENVCLNRGTPAGNLCVLRGQGWITVTSCTEGTSHVTVFAPEVVCCDHRMEEAVIDVGPPARPRRPTAVCTADPNAGRRRRHRAEDRRGGQHQRPQDRACQRRGRGHGRLPHRGLQPRRLPGPRRAAGR